MATKTFTSGSKPRKPLTFALDDRTFTFTPPKLAGMVLDLLDGSDDEEASNNAAQAAFDWLSDGLPEEESELLVARLRDPDDPLDLPDVVEIIRWLLGKVADRPTTSRRG